MVRSGSVPSFEFEQVIPPFGLRLPARMTVLPLEEGGLALVSPIPIDDALAGRLAGLGAVRFLIAPNLLHHLHLGPAAARYPEARVLAPPGLSKKRPELTIHHTLDRDLPPELLRAVEFVRFEGAPSLDEFVLFHRASRALVVTELVFNVIHPRGFFTNLVLGLVGCRGRLAQSRALRFLVKDRRAAAASVERILELPFESVVPAHGEIVNHQARDRLAEALRGYLPLRRALPA